MIRPPDARLVVTGFGPFGDHDYNPSSDAARALAECADTDVHLLPVAYTEVAPFTEAHLRATTDFPVLFVHLGLGTSSSEVRFERRAQNRRDARPDQRQRRRDADPGGQPLVKEPTEGRTTHLEVSRLVASFNERRPDDLPAARPSRDCGTYVCNALYYHSLRACRRHRKSRCPADALFIHVPSVDPDDARRLGELLGEVLT